MTQALRCDQKSPLEPLLLKELIAATRLLGRLQFLSIFGVKVLIGTQEEVGVYRPDFCIEVQGNCFEPFRVFVECDGHDFHEKTKEQARRDKSRDREIVRLTSGAPILRFTGSEVYRSAYRCSCEVLAVLFRMLFQRIGPVLRRAIKNQETERAMIRVVEALMNGPPNVQRLQ